MDLIDMKVRPWLLAALLVTLSIAALVALVAWRPSLERGVTSALEDRAPLERKERTTPVVEVAPAPLPTSLPLIGAEGTGADGMPLRYVDRPALRSLLWHRHFADLTRYFTELQDAFEADPTREHWPDDAAEAFATADPALREPLDAWVTASAGSFAPLLARGCYLVHVGFARRGGKYDKDTPDSDRRAMSDTLRLQARLDLDRALMLRPRLVTAMRHQMSIAAALGGRAELDAIAARAAETCPTCFQFRATYLHFSKPRWGGSYERMAAFAQRVDAQSSPRLRLLQGWADIDRADVARADGRLDEADAAIARAMALGEHWRFLLMRAKIREARKDWEGALADLDRAAQLRPGEIEVLFRRAVVLNNVRRFEDAGRALLAGCQVDATDTDARWIYPSVVYGLEWQMHEYRKAGRREDALRVLDVAVDLAPGDPTVKSWRTALLAGDSPDIPALEEAWRRAPDDFRALQALDYALATKGQYARIVELYTEYLGRHPEDARAYTERSGAWSNLKKMVEALADAQKACALGSHAGCSAAKVMGSRLPR
jgi:tetratricopeptide (TPR) repeat protein